MALLPLKDFANVGNVDAWKTSKQPTLYSR